MTIEITKEKLLNSLEKLKQIAECPEIYLDECFFELRTKVDKKSP